MHSLFCTPYFALPILHSLFCTPYFALLILHSLFCTPYFAFLILYSLFCTPYFVLPSADRSESIKVMLQSQKDKFSLSKDKEEVPENNDVMPFDQPSPKPVKNNSSRSISSFSDHGVDNNNNNNVDNNNNNNNNNNNENNDNPRKKSLAASLSLLITKSAPNSPEKRSSIMSWIKPSHTP